ncbi:MAG: hypothetical protein O6703_05875, partial [Gammaproteobacteria bacterium]|nr:hypothetical protein [Gammaproteobacteria bacterium]
MKHRNKTPKRFAKNCAQALLVGFVCIMAPLASVSAQGGLPFLTLELAIWSVVMAALIAIIIAFIVFLRRQGMAVSKASTAGGVLG